MENTGKAPFSRCYEQSAFLGSSYPRRVEEVSLDIHLPWRRIQVLGSHSQTAFPYENATGKKESSGVLCRPTVHPVPGEAVAGELSGPSLARVEFGKQPS
jgi:hypothetical protein